MPIQLISFDLDDTLWDNHAVMANAEQRIEAFFEEYCPELLAKYSAEEIRAYRRRLMQQAGWQHQISGVRVQAYRDLLQEFMPPEQALGFAARAFYLFMQERNKVKFFEDAEAVLKQLSQHYPLAALTNGNIDLEATALRHYFECVFSAEYLNSSKPALLHFRHLMQSFEIPAEQIVHIGDHPRDDMQAAKQAGLKTIWFNPKQNDWLQQGQEELKPDAEVQTLGQIPAAIDVLSQLQS